MILNGQLRGCVLLCMRSVWKNLLNKLASLGRYLWNYTGTLAVLSLMLGVLGMGLYHVYVKDVGEAYRSVRQAGYYSGVYNPAGPEPPRGIGRLAAPGGDSCIHIEYTDSGKTTRMVCIGADGKVRLLPGSKVAEQCIDYDEQGRMVAKRNLDAQGHPAADAHGVATREFEYDAEGRFAGVVAKDSGGKKITPRMPGYAEKVIEYDAADRPVEIRYLDGNGKSICNAAGESSVTYQYDDTNHTTTRTNYENGTLRDNAEGIAVEHTQTTANGLVQHRRWQNAQGQAVEKNTASSVLEELSPSARTKRVLLCGDDGVQMHRTRACSEHLLRTDASGRPEWECFNGADGHPCINPALGYAEHVWEYDAAGNLVREFFWDASGMPAPCYEKRYSGQGPLRHVISLHRDGSTELKCCD